MSVFYIRSTTCTRPPSFLPPPQPLPRSQALFDESALLDSNVRWPNQWCTSFGCLNPRSSEVCPGGCFNLSGQSRQWQHSTDGSHSIREFLSLANETLR